MGFSEVEFRRIGRTEHRVGHLCRPRRLCSAYGLARRFVLALVLLVEAVDATVWTAEASVGVRHLLHAGDLAEQLAPRRLDRGRGSLGIAISEAVEDAATHSDTNYSLGSVLNHVLLHQTVIGQEAKLQMEQAGEEPDVVLGCFGGGSNFGGLALPYVLDRLAGKGPRIVAVEPTACP